MIPSFSIVGISADYENMAKTIQEFAINQQQTGASLSGKQGISDMVRQLEKVCKQACTELEVEFNLIKNANE